MSDIYTTGEYGAKNPGWHQEHSQWKSGLVQRMLQLHDIQPKRIAEVGCGAGGILESLHRQLQPQPQCVGYEISPQAYAMASQRQTDGLQYKLGSPCQDTVPFDVVLAMDVLEHVENYLDFIRVIGNIGVLKILHIPLDLSVISILKPFYLEQAREHVGHLHYFTCETALSSLEQAGLSVKDWFYTSADIDLGLSRRKRLHAFRKLLFSLNPDFAVRLFGDFSILVLAE
jgi:SAM-dependent methyltransferase